MGLSTLFHISANAVFKRSMICMMALTLPIGISLANATLVNVNTASQTELESIRGLGPSKVKAIIAEREKAVRFMTPMICNRVLEVLASARLAN